jgi:hypothetical protein
MMEYRKAVEWLTPICKGVVKNRRLAFRVVSFSEPFLELKLKIIPANNSYSVPYDSALYLLEFSDKNPGAYDLSCKIVASNLVSGSEIPEPLRLLAAKILIGDVKRPKGTRADSTWMANQYKLAMILRTARDFGLYPTRGDNNPSLSACDAVSEAFASAGFAIDYASLKKLCVEKRYQRLRDELSLWSYEASLIGPDVIAQRYKVPDYFKTHVSDAAINRDTPRSE